MSIRAAPIFIHVKWICTSPGDWIKFNNRASDIHLIIILRGASLLIGKSNRVKFSADQIVLVEDLDKPRRDNYLIRNCASEIYLSWNATTIKNQRRYLLCSNATTVCWK